MHAAGCVQLLVTVALVLQLESCRPAASILQRLVSASLSLLNSTNCLQLQSQLGAPVLLLA
jgi:hypothetical protein